MYDHLTTLCMKGLISKGKLPEHLLWMAKLFNYSGFSRCVMIKWYVELTISLGEIGMELKVSYICDYIIYVNYRYIHLWTSKIT